MINIPNIVHNEYNTKPITDLESILFSQPGIILSLSINVSIKQFSLMMMMMMMIMIIIIIIILSVFTIRRYPRALHN